MRKIKSYTDKLQEMNDILKKQLTVAVENMLIRQEQEDKKKAEEETAPTEQPSTDGEKNIK